MPPKKATKAAKSSGDAFEDKVFALSGTLSQTRDEITTLLEENGGTVASTVTKKVTHLITTAEDFASGPSKVENAKKNGIFIVNEDWIHDSIKAGSAKKEDAYLLSKKRKADDDEEEEEEEEKPAKKGKKAAAKKKAESEEEEEPEEKPKAKKGAKKAAKAETAEEEAPVRKSSRATKGKAKAAEDASDDEDEEEEEEKKDEGEKKKIVIKGRAAVDSYCSQSANAHVLEEGSEIYDCMLNQTNIGNNNNKFYVIQLLEKDGGGQYWCWNRWGRVGEKGQNKLEPCGSNKAKAISSFEKKFHDKTKNRWADRGSFKTVSGKYTLIEIDYGADQEPQKEEKVEKKSSVKKANSSSKLDERVQDLVKLIFDLKMMENVMTEMEYDIKKMPLGKLTKKQIKEGYEVLKALDEAITKNKGSHALEELSNRFYTLIPHALGRSKLPIIKNLEVVKSKMNMLEALADIEIATKLMKETEQSDDNPIDHNYAQLKCDFLPLDTDSEEFKQIATYVKNTHEHSTPKIKNVYRINREGEKARFDAKSSLGNRKLLWHGSRLTNYVGIISQGLRIAPPEAPVSGYRFGKGIYFADIMSLSSVYCRSGASNDFCMLLGDVALGKEAELDRDTYMEKPIAGTHSTKALGTVEPSLAEQVSHADGYIIPSGKIGQSGKKNVSCKEHQYIVYDVSQVHLKYMIHLNWK